MISGTGYRPFTVRDNENPVQKCETEINRNKYMDEGIYIRTI